MNDSNIVTFGSKLTVKLGKDKSNMATMERSFNKMVVLFCMEGHMTGEVDTFIGTRCYSS